MLAFHLPTTVDKEPKFTNDLYHSHRWRSQLDEMKKIVKSAIIITIMTNHIVLFEPRIHFNTGNIARTCAATNTHLHLIRPFGFEITDKNLKRAGLDYWDKVNITYHDDLAAFMAYVNGDETAKLHLITKFAEHDYSENGLYTDEADHYFLLGREDTGLPEAFMREHPEKAMRIPMNDEHVRSLNLSNAAAIVIYECLRQQHYQGLELVHTYEKDKLK